eukprot:gene25286-31495_t
MTMAAAVCGMHYTGMEAATFKVSSLALTRPNSFSDNPYYVSRDDVEIPVLLCAMFVLWSIVIVILADLRSDVQRYHLFMKKRYLTRSVNLDQEPSHVSSNDWTFPLYHQIRRRFQRHAKVFITTSSQPAISEE